jgi:hypothetical protein
MQESGCSHCRVIFHLLPADLAYVGLALAAFGTWWLLRRDRRVGLAVLLSFASHASCSPRAHAIRDLESYLLTAVVALGVGGRGRPWRGWVERSRPALALGAVALLRGRKSLTALA